MFNEPTRQEFLQALEFDLRLRGISFEQRDLLEFLDACWTRIAEEPDVNASRNSWRK